MQREDDYHLTPAIRPAQDAATALYICLPVLFREGPNQGTALSADSNGTVWQDHYYYNNTEFTGKHRFGLGEKTT
jgi:hypothetical protein